MTPRRRPRRRWWQRIDWTAINFAFALAVLVGTAILNFGQSSGTVATKLVELERRVDALERASKGRGE